MNSIRILVGAMPRLMRDVVSDAIGRQADMSLIGNAGESDLAAAVERDTPDVVLVADADCEHARSHRQLLLDHAELKVLVVTEEGRSGHLLEFRRLPLAQMSPHGLVAAIRAAMT